ncbi:kappa-type opioid receptor-like [Anneissia japonica]|uniref:kappa-type opioid receptor-like n=1 Tax=Anneissia japonica TaxID=1529436 RepID=UPI00142562E0|nr:kappa-type opioid receptor-like [Anneissia japonica]
MNTTISHLISTSMPPPVVTWSRAERIFQVVCLTMIMVTGIVGNGLVILSVIISRRLRTVTNVYVVNLAVTDLITTLNIPWQIVALLSNTNGSWPLGDWLCIWAAGTSVVCISCSIYTMAMIAISRLISIASELNHRNACTFRRSWVIVALIFIWSMSVFYASIPALFDVGKLGYDTRYSSCTWDTSHPKSSNYSIILAVLLYPVPFLVIIVCCTLVFHHIRKHTNIMKSELTYAIDMDKLTHDRLNKTQIQVTKNLFCVVVVYVICLTPYTVNLLVSGVGSIKAIPYTTLLLILNSCLNPLIYATKHPDFKTVFKSISKCDLKRIPDRAYFIRNIRLHTR